MTVPNDPRYPEGVVRDQPARDSARVATIVAAIAGVIALIALILALVHMSQNFAPAKCDHSEKNSYVCKPETVTGTTSVTVPSVSQSPTSVQVPTTTLSPTVTTSVVP